MADTAFSPRWMYGPNREAVEVHTQAHMDQVVKDGWQKSPAAFGIETHPQHPVQQITAAGAVTGEAVPALPQVVALEVTVASLQADMESLKGRLDALETLVTAPARSTTGVVSPSTEESESQSGRRRS